MTTNSIHSLLCDQASGDTRGRYHLKVRCAITCLAVILSLESVGYAQSCPNPSYPSPTPSPIDGTTCGPQGSGGAEANQNEAKNNFCAQGTPKPITIAQLVALQQQVQQNPSIPFGNADIHPLTTNPGPATDRAPLQALGEGSLVVLTGYVKVARQEGAESVNCGSHVPDQPAYHDIHISIVPAPSANECSGVVVEFIPHHRPSTWTPDLVNEVTVAKAQVRVTGQLMFDSSHTPCVNGKAVSSPNSSDPARASLWEVHPIYKFEVCTASDCTSDTAWVQLQGWKPQQSRNRQTHQR